jgi:hypothetical protein
MRNLSIAIAPPPPPVFRPITLVLDSPVAVANLIGALGAYGKGDVYAENFLKSIGLGEHYSGNVRKAARETVIAVSNAAGFVPPADFSDYLKSAKFKQSHPSTAGAKVLGTEEDLAPGRKPTSFEAPQGTAGVADVEASDVEQDEDDAVEGCTCATCVADRTL